MLCFNRVLRKSVETECCEGQAVWSIEYGVRSGTWSGVSEECSVMEYRERKGVQ